MGQIISKLFFGFLALFAILLFSGLFPAVAVMVTALGIIAITTLFKE